MLIKNIKRILLPPSFPKLSIKFFRYSIYLKSKYLNIFVLIFKNMTLIPTD